MKCNNNKQCFFKSKDNVCFAFNLNCSNIIKENKNIEVD